MKGTVSITEARQILGNTAGTISDAQLSQKLVLLNDVANGWLDNYEKKIYGQTINSLLTFKK